MHEKRSELGSLLQDKVEGALFRWRFLQLKYMDAPASFLFGLGRLTAQRMQMTCLKLPGGGVTTNPVEMRSHAVEFYTDLFAAGSCVECRGELLGGLPLICLEEKAALDSELALEELTEAGNQTASSRAPGINGLSREFFRHFWNILGPDLHGDMLECFKQALSQCLASKQRFLCCPKKEP